jgi:mannose-6-phosphate isomerase-like protein (cupin superfamily)
MPMQQHSVSLELACSALAEFWSPRVVGQVNNQFIKVARVHGEFPWHSHAAEDEMFLVLRGELRIGRAVTDGGDVLVRPGEFFVVPCGIRHNTSAAEETWIALIETITTEHTGSEHTPLTRSIAEQLCQLEAEQLAQVEAAQLGESPAVHLPEPEQLSKN